MIYAPRMTSATLSLTTLTLSSTLATLSPTPATLLSTPATLSPLQPLYCRWLPPYRRLPSRSRPQHAWPSDFLQWPSKPPHELVCLASSAHLRCLSFRSASSHIFLYIVQSTVTYLYIEYLLIRPCLISFVAIPRIERTSTIIWMIISIISVVGCTSV